MGCNCGGSKSRSNVQYMYTSPTGDRKTYKTQVEARAAQIRNKGGTIQEVRAA